MIEYIIQSKTQNNTTQYLVKWEEKTHKQNSWLSQTQLKSYPNMSNILKRFQESTPIIPSCSKHKKIRRAGKPHKQKQTKSILIRMPKLKIVMPCLQKFRRHWVFGDRVLQIKQRADDGRYLVDWGHGDHRWEQQDDLISKEGTKMCQFFQAILNEGKKGAKQKQTRA